MSWDDKENLTGERKWETNTGLVWDGDRNAEGILWGGCVESLIVQSSTAKYMPSDEDINDKILVIETAEDIPEQWILEYLLTGFGERGWLNKLQGILVGRPKAWEFDKQNNTEQKELYRQAQQETVLRVVREYNKNIPIIQNLDFGHTDPQIILPLGNKARIDIEAKKIFFNY